MSANSPKLVGVIGRAQHGKSSIGEVLWRRGFKQVAFADALRAMMETLNPIVEVGSAVRTYMDAIAYYGYEKAKQEVPEVRRLLQVMGTDVVRNLLGENAWVDLLDRTIFDDENDEDQYVITDVRFPNEADYVMRNKGILIKVVRPGFDNGLGEAHLSESLVDTLPYDYIVSNSGTLGQLGDGVLRILAMERMYPKARWHRASEQ